MIIRRIESEPYHPTGVLADPKEAAPEVSQPSQIDSKVAEARNTFPALTKNKVPYRANDHVPGVAERVQGHKDF